MAKDRLFECSNCGSDVKYVTGPGRTEEYRRSVPRLPVPDDMPLATCEECKDVYLSTNEWDVIAKFQKPLYLEWQTKHMLALVDAIVVRGSAKSIVQISGIIGIRHKKFMRYLRGEREAPITVLRYLEALYRCPEECERVINGKVLDVTSETDISQ